LHSTDPQLQQYGVRTVDAGVEIGRGDHPAGMTLFCEDATGQTADQLEPIGRRIDEHQLGHRQRVPQSREPSTSSGVYVDPPPTTVSFTVDS